MPRRPLALLPLLAVLLLAACSSTSSAGTRTPPRRARPETVTVTSVQRPIAALHTGTVIAARDTAVAAVSGGRVVRYAFDVGQRVRQGDVLVILGAAELAAASRAATAGANQVAARLADLDEPTDLPDVLAARAELQNAEEAAARAERLREQGSSSDQALTRARTELATARARYDAATAAGRVEFERLREASARARQARAAFDESIIRAPFDGIIVERFVEVGQVVGPNAQLLRILDPQDLRVRFAVSQLEAPTAEVGRAVSIRVGSEVLAGHLVRATPGLVGGSPSRVVDAGFDVPPPASLLPGATVSGYLETGEREELVVVDRASTIRTAGVVRAWVVEGGRLRERLLSVARDEGDQVLVRRGLRAGDQLVKQPAVDFRVNEEVAR